jgi:hypothetical protein
MKNQIEEKAIQITYPLAYKKGFIKGKLSQLKDEKEFLENWKEKAINEKRSLNYEELGERVGELNKEIKELKGKEC